MEKVKEAKKEEGDKEEGDKGEGDKAKVEREERRGGRKHVLAGSALRIVASKMPLHSVGQSIMAGSCTCVSGLVNARRGS